MIRVNELRKLEQIEKVIIHSLDLCLYQASVLIDGSEQVITDRKGKMLRSHNLLEMQALFETMPVESLVLRQQSAYDEMVNQPLRAGSNAMEVPLSKSSLGNPLANFQ